MNAAQNVTAKFATIVPSAGCATSGSDAGLALLLPSLAAFLLGRRRSATPPARG
jgi:MYXO-CTERM domain-containing protein